MECGQTVCLCIHTCRRASAFEQQQFFVLVFNPFPLYQQCATTLQHCPEHDTSGLPPQEALVMVAEQPSLLLSLSENGV